MRDLVRKAGLKPIKFEFSSFTTVIFYRKPLSEEKFISENKELSLNLGIKGKKRANILKLLTIIDKENFSLASFAKNEGIAFRTIQNYIKFLKDNNLIYFEGARKTGRYKLTEKYRK